MNHTGLKAFLVVLSLFVTAPALAANTYPHAISPQDARVLVDQSSAVLVDVRELQEVQAGMAAPAEWYPKSSIDSKIGPFVDYLKAFGNKQIILYCRSGHRASLVLDAIAPYGIQALNMGGFQDWMSAGLPVKKYSAVTE